MAYTPTEWETGDIITAEKLNKAEEGIQVASIPCFYTTITYDDSEVGTLDKTFSEIVEAINSGKNCYVVEPDGPTINYYLVVRVKDDREGGYYELTTYQGPTELMLYAETREDYPTTSEPDT